MYTGTLAPLLDLLQFLICITEPSRATPAPQTQYMVSEGDSLHRMAPALGHNGQIQSAASFQGFFPPQPVTSPWVSTGVGLDSLHNGNRGTASGASLLARAESPHEHIDQVCTQGFWLQKRLGLLAALLGTVV